MFRIFIEKPAKVDIGEAYIWYKNIRPELAQDFRVHLRSAYRRITDLPEVYPIVGKRLRRALIPKFSYGVYYLVDGNIIRIFAVMHTSRDPEIWRSREH